MRMVSEKGETLLQANSFQLYGIPRSGVTKIT